MSPRVIERHGTNRSKQSTGLLVGGEPGVRSSIRLRPLGTAVLMLAGVLAGCAPSNQEINAFIHDWEASVSGTKYVVQPPDSIQISSATAQEIDGEVQVIRSDGKISLRLIGDVKVSGLTPVEISRKLESMLRKFYLNPVVNVRIDKRDSKRFYVFGQVARPGPYRYTGRDTVLDVLARAQPNFLAWKSQIQVIRPSHDGDRRHVVVVDAQRIMERGDLEMNVHLEEGDIMYVPPTPLAWVGLRVRELLFPLQPVSQAITGPAQTAQVFEDGFLDDD